MNTHEVLKKNFARMRISPVHSREENIEKALSFLKTYFLK